MASSFNAGSLSSKKSATSASTTAFSAVAGPSSVGASLMEVDGVEDSEDASGSLSAVTQKKSLKRNRTSTASQELSENENAENYGSYDSPRKTVILSKRTSTGRKKGNEKEKGKNRTRAVKLTTIPEDEDKEDEEAVVFKRRPPPLNAAEKEQHRLEKNKARRTDRIDTAKSNPDPPALEPIVKRGRLHAPAIGPYWREATAHLARRELAQQQVIGAAISDLEVVQAAVKAFTDHEIQISIPDNYFASLPPRTIQLLAAVARDPTGWDIVPHLKSGAIALSQPTDPPPLSSVHTYLRRIATGTDTCKLLLQYLCEYPADAPYVIVQLVVLGEPLANIEKVFMSAMEGYGVQSAVKMLFEALYADETLLMLAGTHRHQPATTLLYAGITYDVPCGKRGWDDVEQGVPARIVNFLETEGNDNISFETYRIMDLTTAISDPLDMRQNPMPSYHERVVRAVAAVMAMNSADGGVLPVYLPSPLQSRLKDAALALCPLVDTPLGQESDPGLVQKVRDLLDDEEEVLVNAGFPSIHRRALDKIKEYAADTLRLRRKTVIKVEITKDLTEDSFNGRTSYWEPTVGEGPSEHRHVLQLIQPDMVDHHNLGSPVLARFVGSILDFWRLLLWHILWLLHVLWLSRLLRTVRPLIVVTHSNPIAALVRAGDLHDVWKFLSPQQVDAVMAGNTPPELVDRLPNRRYREFRGDAFYDVVGVLATAPTGPHPSDLAIHAALLDSGRLKYDPAVRRWRWDVDFLARTGVEVLQSVAAVATERETVDREDGNAVKIHLDGIIETTDSILQASGVTAALDQAKASCRRAELSLNFLRSVKAVRGKHERWIESQSGTERQRLSKLKTSPHGPERYHQLDQILVHARLLHSLGLPHDPDHFGFYECDILSDEWAEWFLGLKPNIEVYLSANARGRTPDGAENANKNQYAFGKLKKKFEMDRDLKEEALKAVASAGRYFVVEINKAHRIGTCPKCKEHIVGQNNKASHTCKTSKSTIKLTPSSVSDIERVITSPDILGNGHTVSAVENPEVLADKHGLLRLSVHDVVNSPRCAEILQNSGLHANDIAALSAIFPTLPPHLHAWIPQARIDDEELRITMAVDVILDAYSLCPVDQLPVAADDRRTETLVAIVCRGKDTAHPPRFSLATSTGRTVRADGFFEVKTLVHLPPHHARFLWCHLRRGVDWPPPKP
ncbi:hypothetical protein R3P38DRAFT_3341766 [Favolaschia claudopus]|uniref:Uncharacterized protein n=1 Tax=Favolaschia claudopus TaxID=2862362 RepID=A0AAW0E1I7_9AGAR